MPYLILNTSEYLKCLQPILGFTHPTPPKNHPPLIPQNILFTNHEMYCISWNIASLNTTILGLQNLINKTITPPAIIVLQETKLTSTKSTNTYNAYFLITK
jgi:hypothetical protein